MGELGSGGGRQRLGGQVAVLLKAGCWDFVFMDSSLN